METKPIYAIYANEPAKKPGMFRTAKDALRVMGITLAACLSVTATMVGIVMVIASYPTIAVRTVLGVGMLCTGYLLAANFWSGNGWSKAWGTTLFLLIISNAINILGRF